MTGCQKKRELNNLFLFLLSAYPNSNWGRHSGFFSIRMQIWQSFTPDALPDATPFSRLLRHAGGTVDEF